MIAQQVFMLAIIFSNLQNGHRKRVKFKLEGSVSSIQEFCYITEQLASAHETQIENAAIHATATGYSLESHQYFNLSRALQLRDNQFAQ